ncbi:MAG: hypothetical protein HKN39_07105 [Flavobacteriales bacterium]|nr:hypothetical protein [Flavobacteriales bacterium]
MKNFIKTLRYISFPTILLGALFKIMHWPFASILLIMSMACMFLYFTLNYLVKRQTFWQDHVYFLLSTIVLYFVLTRIMRWPDITIIMGCTASLLVFLYVLFIKKPRRINEVQNDPEISLFHSNIGLLPLALITLGVAFRLLNIPGSGVMFIMGFIAQAIHMFLINSRAKKEQNWEGILDAGEDLREDTTREIE